MIGGMTVKDTTRRVMSALFSNMLAMQFNFKGHGKGNKHAFSQLLLKDVVNGEATALMNFILSSRFVMLKCMQPRRGLGPKNVPKNA